MGEGWVGVAVAQGCGNDRVNPLRIAKYIMVPESDNSIAFCFDQSGPFRVHFTIVLAAIAFDYQVGAVAGEVHDVVAQRHLAPEAGLGERLAQ
jgi:hypothetical protein